MRLTEFGLGGTDFADNESSDLLKAITFRRRSDSEFPLRKFALLNAILGHSSVDVLSDFLSCGLTHVTLLAGQLSDLAAASVAKELSDRAPLRCLTILSSLAGNTGLAAFSDAWARGAPLQRLELAFGAASAQICQDKSGQVNDLRSSGKQEALGVPSPPIVSGDNMETQGREFYCTDKMVGFLEEVVFPRLLLRSEGDLPRLLRGAQDKHSMI